MPDVQVCVARGKKVTIRGVAAGTTVGQFKAKLAAHPEVQRPAPWIQLSARGTVLGDDSGVGSGLLDLTLRPPMESQTQRSTLGPGMAEADETFRLREVFRAFDADGSGQIDARELRAALSASGVDVTQADADAVLQRLDTVERDGQLDFEEFRAAFKDMAASEIDVSSIRGKMLDIRGEIAAERRAKAAAEQAVATDAAKIHAMEAELAEVEAGLKEMALGKPGGNMVSKSQQRLREGAVCRVLHPTKGVGTGFLVTIASRLLRSDKPVPSLLLVTNNHVLKNTTEAFDAFAEFDYEEDKTAFEVSLQPERFFITSEPLDYTMVAVDESELRHIQPIPLRSGLTGQVTEGAVVTVTQHPGGRMKMSANQVVKSVVPPFVRYVMDTEYGSSGSPVFMNMRSGMEVVAVHHQRAPKDAANQGILLDAILADLTQRFDPSAVGNNTVAGSSISSNRSAVVTAAASATNVTAAVTKATAAPAVVSQAAASTTKRAPLSVQVAAPPPPEPEPEPPRRPITPLIHPAPAPAPARHVATPRPAARAPAPATRGGSSSAGGTASQMALAKAIGQQQQGAKVVAARPASAAGASSSSSRPIAAATAAAAASVRLLMTRQEPPPPPPPPPPTSHTIPYL